MNPSLGSGTRRELWLMDVGSEVLFPALVPAVLDVSPIVCGTVGKLLLHISSQYQLEFAFLTEMSSGKKVRP